MPDDPTKSKGDGAHLPSGAPKDAAHAEVGDGTLQGAVPAGLTPEQLEDIARSGKTDDGGTG